MYLQFYRIYRPTYLEWVWSKLRTEGAYVRLWIWLSLVQVMACSVFGPRHNLNQFCWLPSVLLGTNFFEIWVKQTFPYSKYVWKCHLQNDGNLVSNSIYQKKVNTIFNEQGNISQADSFPVSRMPLSLSFFISKYPECWTYSPRLFPAFKHSSLT